MADQYKKLWECGECFEISASKFTAAVHCGSGANEVHRCEVCSRDHYKEADAKQCCFKIANPRPAERRPEPPQEPYFRNT